MVQRVPDEYFRQRAAESDDVDGAPDDSSPHPAAVATAEAEPAQNGVTLRATAIIVTLSLALAFIIGRLFIFTPQAAPVTVSSPAVSPTWSPEPSPVGVQPYTGEVESVRAVAAAGECTEGGTRESPAALIDDDPETLWRCRGSGVGETFTLVFEGPVPLVGIRLVNGNTAWLDRYRAERRITAVRWTFTDGSYFEQGLATNDPNPQEVRFPHTETERVTIQVLSATAPGEADADADAISISSLEFLVPAE